MENNIENNDLNNNTLFRHKLEELGAILDFLNSEFGIQYCLNYTKSNQSGQYLIQDMMTNEGLNAEMAKAFAANIHRYAKFINQVPDAIRKGHHLVKCVDDRAKPKNVGDWVEKDKYYIVTGMVRVIGGGWAYTFKGLKTNKPFVGYSTGRFRHAFVDETFN